MAATKHGHIDSMRRDEPNGRPRSNHGVGHTWAGGDACTGFRSVGPRGHHHAHMMCTTCVCVAIGCCGAAMEAAKHGPIDSTRPAEHSGRAGSAARVRRGDGRPRTTHRGHEHHHTSPT